MLQRNFFYHKERNTKSVRKNAFWVQVGNKKYMVSYQTIVCSVDDKGVFEKYWNDYSVTTMNQINCFLSDVCHGDLIRSDTGEVINYRFGKKEWLGMGTSELSSDDYYTIKPLFPDIEYGGYNYSYVAKLVYR